MWSFFIFTRSLSMLVWS